MKHLRQKPPPSLERLRHLFRYEPDTGLLIRRVWAPGGRANVGDVAGTPNGRGPLRVGVDGDRYQVHLIAWYLMTGNWPMSEIDHEDTNASNNRWNNLRLADRSDQLANRKKSSLNKSGFKGVCLDKRRGLYRAEITRKRKAQFLGYFARAEDAHAAYAAAAIQVHGEFARAA